MKNVSDKTCRGNQNSHIVFSSILIENRSVYEKMWKHFVERGRPQMTTRHMRISFWVPKATNTYSQYVILIIFPLQQWLQELASMLRYTSSAYVFIFQ
jgi:hypothetical protein